MTMYSKSRQRDGANCTVWLTAVLLAFLGCQSDQKAASLDEPISAYRDRMLAQHQDEPAPTTRPARAERPVARPAADQASLPERQSLLTQPPVTTQPAPADILSEVPDPTEAAGVFQQRLERIRREQTNANDDRVARNYQRVMTQTDEYLRMVARPDQLRLGLRECIQRALSNNYAIRIEAHNPAISQTQIVEAEAAFDVQFFLDSNWADMDQATSSALSAGKSDTRSYQGGFRKLLATGAQASVALGQSRSKNDMPAEYQSLNPAYPSNFIVNLRQPLLRGFGLEVNRAQIEIRRVQYGMSYDAFVQRVRDTLLDVESAYWQLARARRTATILAESVAQTQVTYQNMLERLDHDATQVEVANAKSRWESRHVEYLETVKAVHDAEDRLKNLLNDPDLKLSQSLEIIPIETPCAAPLALDHFAEVRTALERRSEIQQARKQIEVARISASAAKNATLPQLDLNFQYEVQGLADTLDNSFDRLTTNRYISYTLGASFSYNFGERAARAGLRRARLEESKAVVTLNQATDAIVEEVNQTIRTLMVRYAQIPTQLESVRSAELYLRSLQARTQRIDPNYLQTELAAVEQLANTRQTLLQVLTEYNVGVVQLEKAKGTLLDYNNVVVDPDAAIAR